MPSFSQLLRPSWDIQPECSLKNAAIASDWLNGTVMQCAKALEAGALLSSRDAEVRPGFSWWRSCAKIARRAGKVGVWIAQVDALPLHHMDILDFFNHSWHVV